MLIQKLWNGHLTLFNGRSVDSSLNVVLIIFPLLQKIFILALSWTRSQSNQSKSFALSTYAMFEYRSIIILHSINSIWKSMRNFLFLLARPCCTGVLGDCVLTSKDDCRRRRGIFHPRAHLCSQVRWKRLKKKQHPMNKCPIQGRLYSKCLRHVRIFCR